MASGSGLPVAGTALRRAQAVVETFRRTVGADAGAHPAAGVEHRADIDGQEAADGSHPEQDTAPVEGMSVLSQVFPRRGV